MARVGRTAKSIKRENSGRASRVVRRELEGLPPIVIKRMMNLMSKQAMEGNFGTATGVMFCHGRLTAVQFRAAQAWAKACMMYYRAIQASSPDPKSLSIGQVRSEPPDVDSIAGQEESAVHVEAVKSYIKGHAELKYCDGNAVDIVTRCCSGLGSNPVGHGEYLVLKKGLDVLANHWGLTKDPENVRN